MANETLIPLQNVTNSTPSDSIKVGVSACLLGQKVRYNGGHSQSKLCQKELKQHFEFHPFCPEAAAGFGTPRPAMHLTGDPANPILTLSNDHDQDLTNQLINGFTDRIDNCGDLDGYILMKNSPSCGLERIKVYRENGYPHEERVRGLFTEALMKKFPTLPVEEEGRLHDPRLKENFILRVFAHNEFRKQVLNTPSVKNLMAFHSTYKYILMAHNQFNCKQLGKLVSKATKKSIEKDCATYFHGFMASLIKPANTKNHTNTLLHILGYLKNHVSPTARQQIADIIYKYHKGQIPLVTPIILLKHYIDQYGSDYIKQQKYFHPYPETLGLTNRL